MGDFESCIKKADQEAARLAEKIARFPESQRKKTIIIGHSLGGRIAIRTLALLHKQGIKIERGIFLAAAIPDDDPDISLAISGTLEPNLNLYNRQDFILRHVYGTMGEGIKNAMGAYGYGMPYRKVFLYDFDIESEQCPVLSVDDYLARFENHDVQKYLNALRKILDSPIATFRYPHVNTRRSSFEANLLWKKQETKDGWILEKHCLLNQMRILTPEKAIKTSGTVKEITAIWQNDIDVQRCNSNEFIRNICVLQDRPNSPLKVIDVGWDTIESFCNWRFQKKDVPFQGTIYRIVDPKDFQRANGNETQIHYSFTHIRIRLRKEEGM